MRWLCIFTLCGTLITACIASPYARNASSSTTLTGMNRIPTGTFHMGSTPQEREYAYSLDEKRGSSVARNNQWFENETQHKPFLSHFHIDTLPVTQQQYQTFILSTGHLRPAMTPQLWHSYRLIHPYHAVERFLWQRETPPAGREQHPIVLVSHADAQAYCRWQGKRLPTEQEWEKAARGTQGDYFPWGDYFDAKKLNSQDLGPYDTLPVGKFPTGISPYGVLDMAGQVFEWTSTACNDEQFIVKGGSWDDLPGVTRAAARHCRPQKIKHILIGFRCAHD